MKKNAKYILTTILITVYLTLTLILIISSIHHYHMVNNSDTSLDTISKVSVKINNKTKEYQLPYNFSDLKPSQPITISFTITPNKKNFIYVKTVYAPLKVYANNELIYSYGDKGTQPHFLIDPPTKVKIVELPHSISQNKTIKIKIIYKAPKKRNSLMIHPFYHGKYKSIINLLYQKMSFTFTLAIINIFLSLVLIILGFIVLPIEKKSIAFIWLGLFALLTGLFSVGECNLSQFYIPNEALLYVLDFCTFFILPIPLIEFGITLIDFKNKKFLRILQLIQGSLAILAIIGQVLTTYPLFKSLYLFIILSPVTLITFACCIIGEYIQGNMQAKGFILPISIVSLSAIVEAINYKFRFVSTLSSCFMVGVLLFIIIIGFNSMLYIKKLILLKESNKALEYNIKLMEKQMAAQEERNNMVQKNATIIKSQRHDLRHHLTVIQHYNNEGNKEKITEYLNDLLTSIPTEQSMNYCENQAVNAILIYFISAYKDIDIHTQLSIPNDLKNVKDNDLCIIMGNLLENAIEACNRIDDDSHKYININSRLQYDTLTITVDNSFNGSYKIENGIYISSKRNEPGIGISSVKKVVEKYNGDCRFEAKDNTFMASVYIKI